MSQRLQKQLLVFPDSIVLRQHGACLEVREKGVVRACEEPRATPLLSVAFDALYGVCSLNSNHVVYVSKSRLVASLPVGDIYKAEKFECAVVKEKQTQWISLILEELNKPHEVPNAFREAASTGPRTATSRPPSRTC